MLAVVSNAPGFFERRNLDELFHPKTQWNDLTLVEQRNLIILGWHADAWDGKYDERNASNVLRASPRTELNSPTPKRSPSFTWASLRTKTTRRGSTTQSAPLQTFDTEGLVARGE